MPGNFKIFISYRRKGGYDTAKLIYDRLRLDGYSVFFDIDSLKSGNFDKELEKKIKKCKDFILVLSPGIFDKAPKKDDDWVQQEIEYALKANKNIIPIVLEGFAFPKNLPSDIREEVSKKNTLELIPRYFEPTYEKMKESFLVSKPRLAVRSRKPVRNFIAITIFLLAAYLFFEAYSYYVRMRETHKLEIETMKIEIEAMKIANEREAMRITDSMRTIIDSIKTIADSMRITSELEKKHMVQITDPISKAKTPLPAKTVVKAATKPTAQKAASSKQKSKK